MKLFGVVTRLPQLAAELSTNACSFRADTSHALTTE